MFRLKQKTESENQTLFFDFFSFQNRPEITPLSSTWALATMCCIGSSSQLWAIPISVLKPIVSYSLLSKAVL